MLTDLQSVASPLGQPTAEASASLRADDEARTRDLNLGKVALYQLSYVRLRPPVPRGAKETIAEVPTATNSGQPCAPGTRDTPANPVNVDRMHAWVNGQMLTDPQSPAIVVTDHGLTVGDGVFEAIKVVDGRPFALTRHLERLGRSAAALGLPAPDLDERARRRRRRARPGDAAAGAASGSPTPAGRRRSGPGGATRPPTHGRGRGADGPRAQRRQPSCRCRGRATSAGRWPGVKSTSYAENVVALAEAAKHGATEAVFANLAGHLCEGTGSNVGYVVGGEVRTPTLGVGLPGRRDQGAAPGVVRRDGGRRADGGARLGRRDLPALHHP